MVFGLERFFIIGPLLDFFMAQGTGANDVANAVGPLAGTVPVAHEGALDPKVVGKVTTSWALTLPVAAATTALVRLVLVGVLL